MIRGAIVALKEKRKDRGQHAGLLLQRYLSEKATGEEGNPEEKRAILHAAIAAAINEDVRALHKSAFERWSAALPAEPPPVDLQTAGRLVIGLSSENVLETGIRLHHTFGMPIIPGSALKGLAAHYCDQAWGMEDDRFRKPTSQEDEGYRSYLNGRGPKPRENYHRLLFGTTDDSGCIVFHDAWYVPNSSPQPLVLDVMTPHHPKWLDGSAPPTDFDSPRPVPFLSVTGKFRVAVSWSGPQHSDALRWTEAALALLRRALSEWGIGGKTSSGYGRLVEDSESWLQDVAHAASTRSITARAPALPAKRNSGTRTVVRIIGTRGKGFDVQEEGRPQGTLTVGYKPAHVQANTGDNVDVEVHDDTPRKPQYRWPSQEPTKKGTDRVKPKR
jgi:CRISPR-associated protein Cmr6